MTITCKPLQLGKDIIIILKNKIMQLEIASTTVPVSSMYDNEGAHKQVKLMMQKDEILSIKFYTTKDGYPCAWIESPRVAGFKYLLTSKALTWLFNYLIEGESEDFGVDPTKMEANTEGEEDIQISIAKKLIELGKRIQFTPLFRERNSYISAIASFFKGKIYFKFKRTDELLDYLREHNQTI